MNHCNQMISQSQLKERSSRLSKAEMSEGSSNSGAKGGGSDAAPKGVPRQQWAKLTQLTNDTQLSAVRASTLGTLTGLTLLQGPPGTGMYFSFTMLTHCNASSLCTHTLKLQAACAAISKPLCITHCRSIRTCIL